MATMTSAEPNAAPHGTLSATPTWLRAIGVNLRIHTLALGVVGLCFLAGQVVTLTQSPFAAINIDTQSYVSVAQTMLTRHQILNASRTPAYPLLLALVFLIFGPSNYVAVVWLQSLLMLVATIEVYTLAYLLSSRRWLSALCAIVVGTNLYILDWERAILPEALACFLTVTMFLCFAAYIRFGHRNMQVALALICISLLLTRPGSVVLPAVLLLPAALWRAGMQGRLSGWRGPLLAFGLAYGSVLIYMAALFGTYGYFGITDISNINLFGKVLEYRMQDQVTDPQYAQLRTQVDQYLATVAPNKAYGPVSPWPFVLDSWHPAPHNYQYTRDHYRLITNFAKDAITHHPLEFAAKTVPDLAGIWLAHPIFYYAPYAPSSPPLRTSTSAMVSLSGDIGLAYLLFPVAVVLLVLLSWKRPHDPAVFLLVTIAIAVTANIVVNAIGSYAEFYRLRSTMDGLMLVLIIVLTGIGLESLLRHVRGTYADRVGLTLSQGVRLLLDMRKSTDVR